jgi:hypothetical protein
MEIILENNPVIEAVTHNSLAQIKGRGRPKIDVNWPEGKFTFESLRHNNVLSSSSLRKKMRAELKAGGLVKVDTLKVAFGRPQNVYEKA